MTLRAISWKVRPVREHIRTESRSGPNLRTYTSILVIGMPSQSIGELSSHFTPGRLDRMKLFIIVDAALFFYSLALHRVCIEFDAITTKTELTRGSDGFTYGSRRSTSYRT